MRKTFIILTAATLILTGCASNKKAPTPASSNNINNAGTNNQTNTSTPAANPAAASVSIQNFAFSPESVTIKKGDTITWVNDDPAPHSIKSIDFNSQVLNTGDKFSFQFNTAGTYQYSCGIHASMKGTIIVN